MRQILTNKYFLFSCIVIGSIILWKVDSCNQFNKGKEAERASTDLSTKENNVSLANDNESKVAKNFQLYVDSTEKANKPIIDKLKSQERDKTASQNKIKQQADYIKTLSDSVKKLKTDSAYRANPEKTIISILNYEESQKENKVCDSAYTELLGIVSGVQGELNLCKKLNAAKETTKSAQAQEIDLLKSQVPKKQHPILKGIKNVGLAILSAFASVGAWNLWQTVK